MNYVIGYVAALVTMVVLDAGWLGLMGQRLYKATLGDIMLPSFNIAPAVVFYLLYPVGLLVFAVFPALRAGSIGAALIYGALFGLFTYATYDLTNQATLRNWTLMLTVADVAWGTVLTTAGAVVSFWLVRKFGG